MARFVRDLALNKPDDFVAFIMNDYLQKNQFIMSDWHGEPAYRAGDAMVEGFKYLKWNYQNGVFHLEAWLQGTFGKEMNLDGFVGSLNKKPYKESLEQLFAVLQQPLPNQGMQPNMQGNPNMQYQYQQPIPVQTVDNTGAAKMALVFGIISLILAFIAPLFAIVFGCVGVARARMGAGSSKAGMAKTGKILCIIGMVIAAVVWLLNIVVMFL